MSGTLVGLLWAGLSALAFGSFSVFIKAPEVEQVSADAMVFQAYFSTAVFCSGFFALIFTEFVFTWYAFASAGLWTGANVLAIIAIKLAGIAPSQGIWSAATIIVSFLWGLLYFHEDVHNPLGAGAALVVLCIGVYGISRAAAGSDSVRYQSISNSSSPSSTLGASTVDQNILVLPTEEDNTALTRDRGRHDSSKQKLAGYAAAGLIGLLNGSMLVPLKLSGVNGLDYVTSFGMGVLVVTPPIALVYFILRPKFVSPLSRVEDTNIAGISVPPLHFDIVYKPAFLSGLVWSVGNFASIMTADSALGLTVGFPLTQCALLVGGLWGVFYFKEIVGKDNIVTFFVASAILLGGAAMLAVFG